MSYIVLGYPLISTQSGMYIVTIFENTKLSQVVFFPKSLFISQLSLYSTAVTNTPNVSAS